MSTRSEVRQLKVEPEANHTRRIQAMGIRDRPTSFRSPWQNGHVERLIGSIRRECTDHLIALNEEHLRRILTKFST
jgi:transposase InsO family protein